MGGIMRQEIDDFKFAGNSASCQSRATMRRQIPLLALTVATLLVTSVKAEADGEASFFYGRSSTSDVGIENMTTFGGTLGAYSRIVGFELGVEYSPTSSFAIEDIEAGASLTYFMGNVVFQIPFGAVIPFGTVGYGVISGNPSVDIPAGFLGTVGAFNYGFGGRFFFSEHVGIRVDWRRFALQTDDEAPEFTIPLTEISINTTPKINRFAIGVAFRW
jgi:hypothetical protein